MNPSSRQGELLHLAARRNANVGPLERLFSVALGARCLRASLRRRAWLPSALSLGSGAFLLYRGLTGRCAVYHGLGLVPDERFAAGPLRRPIRIGASIEIARPPGEVYQFWRELEPLVRTHESLRRVERLSRDTSAWTAQAGGQELTWTVRIVEDVYGERIAWETLEGAFRHRGRVDFEAPLRGSGTLLSLDMTWFAPVTAVGSVLRMLGRSPSERARRALRHVKELIEAGEIPVSGSVASSGRLRSSSKPRARTEGEREPVPEIALASAPPSAHLPESSGP